MLLEKSPSLECVSFVSALEHICLDLEVWLLLSLAFLVGVLVDGVGPLVDAFDLGLLGLYAEFTA